MVLYYGAQEWDGSYDLHGMLHLGEQMYKVRNYIHNYKMNLVWARNIKETECFKTGLRDLFGILEVGHDKEKFKNYVTKHADRLSNLDNETYDAISVLTNSKWLSKEKSKYKNKGGRKDMDMIKGLD